MEVLRVVLELKPSTEHDCSKRHHSTHILYTDTVSVKNTMMRKSVHFNNYTEYISHFGNENSAQCATHTHTSINSTDH